jgi:hypothetical protein
VFGHQVELPETTQQYYDLRRELQTTAKVFERDLYSDTGVHDLDCQAVVRRAALKVMGLPPEPLGPEHDGRDEALAAPTKTVPRALLVELSEALRQTAELVSPEEVIEEDLPPGQYVRSQRLLYYADLLEVALDGPDALPADWHELWSGAFQIPPPPPEILADQILDREQLSAILKNPPSPCYVYLLIDEQDEVFYVGKGRGRRLFSHEEEVFEAFHKRFTNWKKLNKIARIINKGFSVRYVIDSWHEDDRSALDRENDLFFIYSAESGLRLCNWGGNRPPSKLLLKLRRERGLD